MTPETDGERGVRPWASRTTGKGRGSMGPGREAAGNLDFGESPAEPSTIKGVHIRTISIPRSPPEHDVSHLKTVLGGWEHSYQLPWGPWAPSRRGGRPGPCLLHKSGGTFSFSSCHRTLKTPVTPKFKAKQTPNFKTSLVQQMDVLPGTHKFSLTPKT